jgi:hypothetical protein
MGLCPSLGFAMIVSPDAIAANVYVSPGFASAYIYMQPIDKGHGVVQGIGLDLQPALFRYSTTGPKVLVTSSLGSFVTCKSLYDKHLQGGSATASRPVFREFLFF